MVTPNPEDQKHDSQHDRVFEFTPDLNISPIKNSDQESPILPKANTSQKPSSPLQDAVGRLNLPAELRSQLSGNSVDGRNEKKATTATPENKYKNLDPEYAESLKKLEKEKIIRTYESDVKEVLAKKNVSVASIAVAESEKKSKEREDEAKQKASQTTAAKEAGTDSLIVPPPAIKHMAPPQPEPVKTNFQQFMKENPLAPDPTEPKQATPTPETDTGFIKPQATEVPKPDPIPEPEPVIEKVPIPEPVLPPPPPPTPKPPVPEPKPEPVFVPETMLPNKALFNQNFITTASEEIEPPRHGRKLFFVLLSMFFVLGGVAVGYYLYTESPLADRLPTIIPSNIPDHKAIFNTDTQIAIPIDNLQPEQVIEKIKTEISKSQASNTIKEIVLTQTRNESIKPLTGPEAARLLKIPAPDMLQRSLTKDWMLGVFADESGQKTVFIIATQNFFQNAFAGMLSWEKNMASDLAPLIGITNLNSVFEDGIVKNKDIRELRSGNTTILVYSFIDSQKIIITVNEATLSEVVTRLERRGYVR